MDTSIVSSKHPSFVTCFWALSVELSAGLVSTILSETAIRSQSSLGHGVCVHMFLLRCHWAYEGVKHCAQI